MWYVLKAGDKVFFSFIHGIILNISTFFYSDMFLVFFCQIFWDVHKPGLTCFLHHVLHQKDPQIKLRPEWEENVRFGIELPHINLSDKMYHNALVATDKNVLLCCGVQSYFLIK